jgi:glycosyltransferase involved in cell wall biosynthesis
MKNLNIIIPVFNEERRIGTTLHALDKFLDSEKGAELLKDYHISLYIVNDGSVDTTCNILEAYENPKLDKYRTLYYPKNRGKGFAVHFGMLYSGQADYYYLADADLASPWSTMGTLLRTAEEGKFNCVIGSRAGRGKLFNRSLLRDLLGKGGNLLIRSVLGLNLNDTQCGYKLFDKNCLQAFEDQAVWRWGYDFEILYLIDKMGLKIKEVPIEWKDKMGSKLKFSHYTQTLKELFAVKRLHP